MKSGLLNNLKAKRYLVIPLLSLGLSACGGGGTSSGGSGSAGSASANTTTSAIDFSSQHQLMSAAASSSCFSVTTSSTTQNTPWYLNGTFVVKNTCTTSEKINGLQINMAASGISLNGSAFQSNGATGITYPAPVYWAATTLGAATDAAVNGKSGLSLTVNTDASGVLTGGSTATFSYGYTATGTAAGTLTFSTGSSPVPTPSPSPQPTVAPTPSPVPSPSPSPTPGGACTGIATWNVATAYSTPGTFVVYNNVKYKNNRWTQGTNPSTNNGALGTGQPWTIVSSCSGPEPTPSPSPAPVAQGAIDLSVNAISLSSVCSGNTTCNIPLILNGQNGSFSSTVATVTNANAGTTLRVSITGLNAGIYTLTVDNNALPAGVGFSAAAINVAANATANAQATFSVTPVTTGTITYNLVQPSGITLATNTLAINLLNASNSSVGSVTSTYGQLSSFSNIAAGSYYLTSYGLADAKAGVYFAPLRQSLNVTAGTTTNVGNVNLSKVTSGLVPSTLTISGLDSGDVATITLTDSNNYTFNTFTAANGNTSLNLLTGDNVVFNVSVTSKYATVAPVTKTITSGSVVTVAVTKASTPVTTGTVYSAYKDVGTSMNWYDPAGVDTYVMSTMVNQTSLKTLATALPSNVNAATWAFATGECGSENWAGVTWQDFAAPNVKSFVNANKNYIVSTGGAAGVFTCSTNAGMKTFIDRYMSAKLIGIDFDIEGGQTSAQITNLVKTLVYAQSLYPNLRISFTLATLADSTSGRASLNSTGDLVVKTAKAAGLDFYVNLMTMDYSNSASASVCVINSSTNQCDMGLSAIQAVKNLQYTYGIPNNRVEVTPLIGDADVPNEIFTLNDAKVVAQYVKANNLAGYHYWSYDRDTPCGGNNTSNTTTCNLAPGVTPLAYNNMIATYLQ